MKDTRIRYNPAERERCEGTLGPLLPDQPEPHRRSAWQRGFLDNLDAIAAACAEYGALIHAVHRNRIERLTIGSR